MRSLLTYIKTFLVHFILLYQRALIQGAVKSKGLWGLYAWQTLTVNFWSLCTLFDRIAKSSELRRELLNFCTVQTNTDARHIFDKLCLGPKQASLANWCTSQNASLLIVEEYSLRSLIDYCWSLTCLLNRQTRWNNATLPEPSYLMPREPKQKWKAISPTFLVKIVASQSSASNVST